MTLFKEFYDPLELLDMTGFDLIPFNGTGDEDLPEPLEGEVTPAELNPDLPIETLSPPILRRPIFACATGVAVTGTLKGATVRVFSGTNLIAEGVSRGGDITFDIKPVKEGERLTARQEFDGRDSPDSFPVTVAPHPKRLPQPEVIEPVYECGRFVVVDHCLPGSTVKLIVDGTEVRSGTAKYTRIRLYTKGAFRTGQVVQAVSTLCEGVHDEPLKSDLSPSVTVKRAPRSLPQPDIDMDSITLGNDRIVVRDCLYNSSQTLSEGQTPWQASYGATSAAAWFLFPAGQTVKRGDAFEAMQRLCVDSPPSPKITVEDDPRFSTLPAPEIVAPICPGERIIAVKGCRPGAVVVVIKGNQAIAVTTASSETCWLSVGDPSGVKAGDRLEARQYIGAILSPPSQPVPVQPSGAVAIQIGRNGVYVNREGEAYKGLPQQYSRVIRIRAKTCCTDLDEGEPIEGRLLDANGNEIAKVPLASYGNGLYEGLFLPDGGELAAGDYTLVVDTPCNDGSGKQSFTVVITTPDASDTTPPKVSMTVRAQGGGRSSLNSTQTSVPALDVFLGEFLNVVAEAEDPEGLMALNVQTSAGTVVGQFKRSNRGTTPIPVKETLSLQIKDLPLGAVL